MITHANYTIRCHNEEEFQRSVEEIKKIHPNLAVVQTMFNQRSVYNPDTHQYEYPGDFQGTVSMGTLRSIALATAAIVDDLEAADANDYEPD